MIFMGTFEQESTITDKERTPGPGQPSPSGTTQFTSPRCSKIFN